MTTLRAIHESLTPVDILHIEKDSLRAYFLDSWRLNEMLFEAIHDHKAFYVSPDPLRNPLIFYYGHTAAFYINKLVLSGLIENGIDAHLEHVLAKGVDPDLPENLDVLDVWPSVSEVSAYREKVKSVVLSVIDQMENGRSIDSNDPYWALLMGIEHARIHFETSSVLIRQLDTAYLTTPQGWEYAPMNISHPKEEWIQSPGGKVQLGKQEPNKWYGWDNEYGTNTLDVTPFEATQNLITNEEYLTFFHQGYNQQQYWSKDGWEWKERAQIEHPRFWVKTDSGFQYRAQFECLEMPMDWPVEVNAYEAEAYCNWKGDGARLLTEAEFNLIANMNIRPEPIEQKFINLNFRYGSPTPVGYCDDSESMFNDLYGNVWDWLGNEHVPLDGFETHPYYEDFSSPYMDADHLMMAGGSWITTGTGASKYYRLWFRPYFYQHAGFRLAKSL